MLNKKTIELTPEKFAEIYTSAKFRNEVAFAHSHNDSAGRFKYKATCSYPTTYIVTNEQIAEAKKELERAKKELHEKHYNDLIMVGMGCDFDPRFEGDIANHRVRTQFKNPYGRTFFIEVGTYRDTDLMWFDYVMDVDLQKKRESQVNYDTPQDYYNYKNLERKEPFVKYTKQALLDFVNKHFDCNFKKVIVSSYTADAPKDYEAICESPKN